MVRFFLFGFAIVCMLEEVEAVVDQAGPCKTAQIGELCNDEASEGECKLVIADAADVPNNKISDACTKNPSFAKLCLKSCLSCCQSPKYSCPDNPNAIPISCDEVKKNGLCTTADSVLMGYVERGCAQTCGLCAISNCTDSNAETCAASAAKCNDASQKEFMDVFCPRTCNRCGCVDLATNCAVNHELCTNSTYVPLMSRQCKKTCNFCL